MSINTKARATISEPKPSWRACPAISNTKKHIIMPLQGIVYILTNKNKTTLYIGVTRNLQRRVAEHKLHINKGFSSRYNTVNLVYYEIYERLDVAIHREKQLKKWHRDWKETLINEFNPEWKDLSEDIGVDDEYFRSVKAAYESGALVASSPEV